MTGGCGGWCGGPTNNFVTLDLIGGFNNEKVCPFEEVGCKFLHEASEVCFNKGSCKIKLCPYKHKNWEVIQNKENYQCEKCHFIGKSGSELLVTIVSLITWKNKLTFRVTFAIMKQQMK